MKLNVLETGNISSLTALEGSEEWLWGTDCTYGDLYEAEELYLDQHRIVSDRLIFVNRINGTMIEPVPSKPGQYFGKPLYDQKRIMILLADFPSGAIRILSFDPDTEKTDTVCEIPRSEIEDCYNLMMHEEPLMITRQKGSTFEIIWPFRKRYDISQRESFCFRRDDSLYFSRWEEDPDYREETVIRDLETGEIKEVIQASLVMSDDGQWWLLRAEEKQEPKGIRDHALVYALIAKQILSALQREKAESLIEEITVSYGMKRGRRMRTKADENHEKADISAYLIHGEWKGKPHENESVMEYNPDNTVSKVSRCAWYDTWKRYGLEEYGRSYCAYIDKALCKGFDGSFDLNVESVLSHGDRTCRFVWNEAADPAYVTERKAENGGRYILPFDFHVEELLECAAAVLEREHLSALITDVKEEYKRLSGLSL